MGVESGRSRCSGNRRPAARAASWAGDIMVLLDDLASVQDLVATCDLVSGTPARCVVLTRRPAGPAWGALLAAGAAAVLVADGSLERMNAVVSRIAEGEPVMDEDRRAELVSAWEEWLAEDEQLAAPCRPALPARAADSRPTREGSRVVEIVDLLGVAETTVRSQIKSIRRKLGSIPSCAPSRCSTGSARLGITMPRPASPAGLRMRLANCERAAGPAAHGAAQRMISCKSGPACTPSQLRLPRPRPWRGTEAYHGADGYQWIPSSRGVTSDRETLP